MYSVTLFTIRMISFEGRYACELSPSSLLATVRYILTNGSEQVYQSDTKNHKKLASLLADMPVTCKCNAGQCDTYRNA